MATATPAGSASFGQSADQTGVLDRDMLDGELRNLLAGRVEHAHHMGMKRLTVA